MNYTLRSQNLGQSKNNQVGSFVRIVRIDEES